MEILIGCALGTIVGYLLIFIVDGAQRIYSHWQWRRDYYKPRPDTRTKLDKQVGAINEYDRRSPKC